MVLEGAQTSSSDLAASCIIATVMMTRSPWQNVGGIVVSLNVWYLSDNNKALSLRS